jgi:glycosyltransferase involved in cell wall biosynthesis
LVLAPTKVDVERFKKGGVKNIAMVRVGYDPKEFHTSLEPMDIINVRGRYVFGVVGSWNYRKGVEEIVKAYCMAFNATDPVSLLLVCKYGNRPHGEDADKAEEWGIRAELRRCIDSLEMDPDMIPHICVLDVPVHPPVLPHIYSRINCLVGFSAGESTWLPGLELAAIGRPIIQLKNECCGYMDYMEGARYLCQVVAYEKCGEKLVAGTSEYYEGQEMGFGNVMELADVMERVFKERRDEVQKIEVNERWAAVQPWQWQRCIDGLCEVLARFE